MPQETEKSGKEAENNEQKAEFAQNKLLSSRSIIISGEINQELAEKVTAQLLVLQEISDDPIKLFINSQGGAM